MWSMGMDDRGRRCWFEQSGRYYVTRIDGTYFITDHETSGHLTFRATLTDAQSAAAFMNGGAA